jgi:phage-related protein
MQAVYHRDPDRREPVNEFIDAQLVDVQEEIDHTIDLLNRLTAADPPLPFPFSSQVAGPLRELRCHYGRRLFRILYRGSDNLFVLLHAFEKNSRAVPVAEIAIADARWADFKARMNALKKMPPRAAGHDAP